MATRKPIFLIVVIAALVPVAGMTIIAWNMVDSVRANAAETDARLRALAWSCLAYADAYDGYPLSEAELRAFTAPDALSSQGAGYPATRSEAGATELAFDAILESIEVEWPMARDVQPILRSKGLPTLKGTAPTVGQWLYAMAERLRER
jgi:hypothetical protein